MKREDEFKEGRVGKRDFCRRRLGVSLEMPHLGDKSD